jgi:two-component system LytT family response regulator
MIQVIIVDDEKKAVSALEKMLSRYFPEINIVATTQQPQEAIELIKRLEPDLVFMDVEMPLMTGFEVLEALGDIHFSTIFTTAYHEYAIKAIRYSALDYLLKPLSEDELRQAIQRYKEKVKSTAQQQQFNLLFDNIKNISNSFSKITVSTIDGMLFLYVNEIIYCESESSYTTFYMRSGEKIVSSKTMKEYEELLPPHLFFRIHHSYLVNMHEIKRYIKGEGGTVILNNLVELPVSKRKKEEFLKKLKLN